MECAPLQSAEAQVLNIKDQAAMCVVNRISVRRRLSTMEADEKEYVSEISKQFLTHLVKLAHCRDADKLKNAAYSMLSILHNLFNSESKVRSFKTDAVATPQDASKSMINTVLGSLDPIVIISNILGAGSNSSDDPVLTTINGILSVLHGFNPVKIDDFAMLYFCNENRGCNACRGLKTAIRDKDHQRSLALFFRCIDHSRFDFGGDEEAAMASPTFMNYYANNPLTITVPLREILLGCIDGTDTNRILSSFGNNTSYGDDDNSWTEALYRAVSNTSLEDRALLTHFYAYMILSRHRRQSGDCITQFMYTIFARFIYSATEMLFCDMENATAEIDGGKFIRYVKTMTNVSVMGSTLNTLKAFLSWRNQNNSVAPVLDIITSEWRTLYDSSPMVLKAVDKDMRNYMLSLAGPSCMVKQLNQSFSDMDNSRSRRQIEKYLPYGHLERCGTDIKVSKHGLGIAMIKSNGRNFKCNSFHIIPKIKGCASLGTSQSSGHQSVFEKVFNPVDSERGTGRILGHITCLIDKKGLTNKAPDPNNFERRVNEFTRDIVFSSNLSSQELVNNNGSYLPGKDKFPLFSVNTATDCFDTKVHLLLLMWQRPNIAKPNLSSLTASQLELMISKGSAEWAKFITRCFFNIERVSFQLADAILKNLGNPENMEPEGHVKGGMGMFDLFVPSHLKNPEGAERLIKDSIQSIYKDWNNATLEPQQQQRNNPYRYHQQQQQPGVKAEFTKGLFDVLYRLIIDEDSCPSKLVAESDSLSRYIDNLDEFLMKLHV